MAVKNKKQKVKIDLIAEVAQRHGYSQYSVKKIVNAFVHQVALALIEGSDVVVQELACEREVLPGEGSGYAAHIR